MRFKRAAQIDRDFYRLGLPGSAERVYFYLSSRCSTRFHVSADEIVAALRIEIKRVRAAIELLVDINLVRRWKFPRPKCTEYLVTLTTEKNWGIGSRRTLSIGSRRTLSWGAGAPYHGEQAHPPIKTLDVDSSVAGDSHLLSVAMRAAREWRFARRQIGKAVISQKQTIMLLEMVRGMRDEGISTEAGMTVALSGIGEYLALPRDPMSDDGRDYRAKTFTMFLTNWTDQWHRAKSYMAEKAEKVVRMNAAQPEL